MTINIKNKYDLINQINQLYASLYKVNQIVKSASLNEFEVNVLIANISVELEKLKNHPLNQILNFTTGLISGITLLILRELLSDGNTVNIMIFLFEAFVGIGLLNGYYQIFVLRKVKKYIQLKEYLLLLKDIIGQNVK